jgi:hypothetical protein
LETPFGSARFGAKKREHFTHSHDILVPPGYRLGRILVCCSLRKIDLTRLIVYSQPRHGVMGFREEKPLQCKRGGDITAVRLRADGSWN